MNSKLVPKSVRLPQDIVDFVEQQPGADFSKKLVAILKEYRSGDEERQNIIKHFDQVIEERRNTYSKLVQQVNKLTIVKNRVDDLAKVVDVD